MWMHFIALKAWKYTRRNCNNGTKYTIIEREHHLLNWKKKSGMKGKIRRKREGNKYIYVGNVMVH